MQYQQPIEEPSTAVNVTVARQQTPREYLTEREIERLMKAAGDNRWGDRDATAILIAYRHGLRASELVSLRWDDIDLAAGKLHVRRAKPGASSVHPIGPPGEPSAAQAAAGHGRSRHDAQPVCLRERARLAAERGRVLAHGCQGR
jgi:integrase